jgi:hypothetical protein
LDDVFRLAPVTEDARDQRLEPLALTGDELGERFGIAAARGENQLTDAFVSTSSGCASGAKGYGARSLKRSTSGRW